MADIAEALMSGFRVIERHSHPSPGPMQSMRNQGGMQRNSHDGERWQRSLIPSPQIALQMMPKAEKKYEMGKVADVEEAKQRQLKAILNKLTPQNFEKLFKQVKTVNIDNAITLIGFVSQIFEKALMEPTFCELYANFCSDLAAELPDFSEDNEKITFKRLLLNKCQEEFERVEKEQEEANKAADEGELKMTNEQREEKRMKTRRRMLGNIRLIGELYKKRMLTEWIMHECIKKLLGEEDIEALCMLMSIIGEMIDHPKAKIHMDVYFERMGLLSNNMNLSPRVRFLLKDAIDLRKNKWQQRRKVEGPKKIWEVHRDASQERQAQAVLLGRGPGNNSTRRVTKDFSPRERRQSYEARTLTIPLPQRPLGDHSARGISIRGSTVVSSSTGFNGCGNLSERAPYSSRESRVPRYVPDRFAGPTAYDQSSAQKRHMNYGSREVSQNTSSKKVWPEERKHDMSMPAIREHNSCCFLFMVFLSIVLAVVAKCALADKHD